MLKIPWLRKRAESGEIKTLTVYGDRDLWWVRVILDIGRPVVAVIVLVMCAPGEHYLARLAGWSDWLAWGMPATLTAYAGIAAVVATKRPKGAPGKRTAVFGAIISVLLAMGAQPIAHLYQQELIKGHLFALTITVSCIPALVFGHLLHMAAVPKEARPKITPGARHVPGGVVTFDDRDIPFLVDDEDDDGPGEDAARWSPDIEGYEDSRDTGMDAGLDYLRGTEAGGNWNVGQLRGAALEAVNRPAPTYPNDDLRDMLDGVDPDGDRSTPVRAPLSLVRDTGTGHEDSDQVQTAVSRPVPLPADTDTGDTGTGTQSPRSVPSRGTSRPGVTSRVRDILRDNPGTTDDEIRDKFAGEDIPRNTINKSIKRVRAEN